MRYVTPPYLLSCLWILASLTILQRKSLILTIFCTAFAPFFGMIQQHHGFVLNIERRFMFKYSNMRCLIFLAIFSSINLRRITTKSKNNCCFLNCLFKSVERNFKISDLNSFYSSHTENRQHFEFK